MEYNIKPLNDDREYTYAELYDPAITIISREHAQRYFEDLVLYSMHRGKITRDEAVKNTKINLAYYAGYFSAHARQKVEDFFECEHPIFGSVAEMGFPTVEECFQLGANVAECKGPKTLKELRQQKTMNDKARK